MTRQDTQDFPVASKFKTRKRFRFAGRNYAIGEDFPWRKLACSNRRLRQLKEARFLEAELPSKVQEKRAEKRAEKKESTNDSFTFDPKKHRIANPSRGTWVVMRGKKVLLTLPAKIAKKLRSAEEKVEIDLD